jgi:SAM-dependent methyltransferase
MKSSARHLPYDEIGRGYSAIRRPDPHVESAVWQALGDARSVVNVGAGSGSYEPRDREVIAVEPSAVMIGQRPSHAARAVQGMAESLPLPTKSVDAAMAVLTLQHWYDVDRGLAELVRVSRQRIVLLTMDVEVLAELWLIRDYIPETLRTHAEGFPAITDLLAALPNAEAATVAVPHDCNDGFMAAFWGRPEAYLDPDVRAATSPWHQLPSEVVEGAVTRLRRDLDSGVWDQRYGALRHKPKLDVGLRLVRAELSEA